jgi:hypothetical protein
MELDENIDEFTKRITINETDFIDIYFRNLIGNITIDNINYLKNILDTYYKMKINSEKYIVDNYSKIKKISYYFEDLFAEMSGGALAVYIMIKTTGTENIDKLMDRPIEEKIKYMPLPDLKIYYTRGKQYDIRMVFDSVKDNHKTSLWFHYNIDFELNKFWIDEIDPWK